MKSFPKENRRGMALVVVLTVVVLAAILVAAFVSVAMLERSSSGFYASSLRAEEVARAGYTTVLADLRREISAGSVLVTNASGNTLFAMPRTNWTILPQTNAVLTNAPALVRFSSTNTPAAFTNTAWFDTSDLPPNRASAVNTATKSRNNRSISAAAWLAPQFAPTNNAATLAAMTNNPPAWTYLTRSGARALTASDAASTASDSTANTNYVTGRYAFAIYDTGGLLDANLAGGATNLLSASLAASKGHQAFADLTRLGLSTAQIADLVQWRNAATAASSNAYLSYLRLTGPKTGFVTGTNGDRAFFSRQDFLRYANLNTWTNTAIANMATFNRTPSSLGMFPTYDAAKFLTSGVDSNPNATNGTNTTVISDFPYRTQVTNNTTGNTNAAFLAVRPADGAPVAKQRFNLDRLLWVTRDGPIASLGTSTTPYLSAYNALGASQAAADFLALGTAENIRKYFGLVWNANALTYVAGSGETGRMWVYYSPTGATGNAGGAKTIKTLAQVATENREPDLFELLQAAMPRGSFGIVTGSRSSYWITDCKNNGRQYAGETMRQATGTGAGTTREQTKNHNTAEMRVDVDNQIFNSQPKYQISAIVANLIDQADSDSFPTALRINSENIFGIEDIPRLFGAGLYTFRPPAGTAVTPNADSAFLHQMALVSVWNPHLPSLTTPSAAPTNFRVICRYGSTSFYLRANSIGTIAPLFPPNITVAPYNEPLNYRKVGRNFASTPAWIQFDSTFSGGMREPSILKPDPTVSTADTKDRLTIAGTVDIVGIRTGYLEAPDSAAAVPPCSARPDKLPRSLGDPATDVTAAKLEATYDDGDARTVFWDNTFMNLELQYQDPSDGWRTYDAIYSFNTTAPGAGFHYLLPGDPSFYTSKTITLSDSSTRTLPKANFCPWQKSMVANANYRMCDPAVARVDPRSTKMNMARISATGSNATTVTRIDVPTNTGSTLNPIAGPYFYASYGGGLGTDYFQNYVNNGRFDYSAIANNVIEGHNATTYYPLNYCDPDYVQRWGDGGGRTGGDPNSSANANAAARPVILNRPFRNVGEIGVVFRDTPWRTLDLLSEKSADAGLLEIFTVGESAATTVAGRVNLNSAGRPVLEALLTGADLNQASTPTTISSASAVSLATDILSRRATNGPIENLSQLPALFPQTNSVSTAYPATKTQREGAVRALAGVGSTRTWNLFIDVIAQSGRLSANATDLGSDFIVQGQKRFWLNVSLDRLTGEVVASQIEPYDQ